MYLSFVLPTRPMSELYGRAQPLGQPVIRVVNTSFSQAELLRARLRAGRSSTGSTRSLSATARPHVGRAGQAIDQRRTAEMSSVSGTPWRRRISSSRLRSSGSMSQKMMLWWGVSRRGGRSVVQISRRRSFEPHRVGVLDAAVLDVQAVEPEAVALLVPAHAVVEAVDADRPRRGERAAEVLFDFVGEARHAPVVDQVLHAGDLAVGPVAEIALHFDDRDHEIDHVARPSM